MRKYQILNKSIGETPLEVVKGFKCKHPELANETVSYAGRLDPMASGKLLLLIGEENKKRKQYEQLDKEYVCEILFGVATDSYDLLGLITNTLDEFEVSKGGIVEALNVIQSRKFQYPPIYSSVAVKGKPLFYWARHGKIDEVKIPRRKIKIYEISLERFFRIPARDLERLVKERVSLVKGDFRQEDILQRWSEYFKQYLIDEYQIARVRVRCSSGTYVRSIASDLGVVVKIPSLALSIERTKIFLD